MTKYLRSRSVPQGSITRLQTTATEIDTVYITTVYTKHTYQT
ncbi:hypothetical protein [Nostoc sp.]